MTKLSLKGLLLHIRAKLSDRAFIAISAVYVAFCLFSSVWWTVNFKGSYLAMSALFILLVPAVPIAEYLIGMRCGAVFVTLVYTIAGGSILGSPFALYSILPHFDTLLHGLSGVLFAALGFTLAERFFGKAEGAKKFAGAVAFALCFSLGIAVVWEIHEYMCTIVLGMETMDDTLIDGFKSFVLGGGRHNPVILDGIYETVIYYGEGERYVIEGGYLDIGIIDTVMDMIICTVGALVFAIIAVISHNKLPIINKSLIPEAVYAAPDAEREAACESDARDEAEIS